MKSSMLAAILDYYRDDVSLQELLGGEEETDVRVAYDIKGPVYPEVSLHLDREVDDPRAGYNYLGVVDKSVQLAFHIYTRDEGSEVGSILLDANSLQMEIENRVAILSRHIPLSIPSIREPEFTSTPLPFEEDTHVHHTSCLLRFVYAEVESL